LLTVKVARCALQIPLALWEKAGETVTAAATYIVRGGADALAVRPTGDRLSSRAFGAHYAARRSASARSSPAPSPRQALPCMHARVVGEVEANFSNSARA